MKLEFKFSLDDVTDAFTAGVRLGRKRQRLLPFFEWSVAITPKPKPKGNPMLTVDLTNEQQATVRLRPQTPRGNPATVDGVPEWKIITGTSCTLQPAADGLSCLIVSSDTDLGTSEVSVTADAELGEGIEEIADFVEVTVGGAKANSLGLSADPPELKPAP